MSAQSSSERYSRGREKEPRHRLRGEDQPWAEDEQECWTRRRGVSATGPGLSYIIVGQVTAIPSPPTAPGTVTEPSEVRAPLPPMENSSTIPLAPVST